MTELELFLAGLVYFAGKQLNLRIWTEQLELPAEKLLLLLYFYYWLQFEGYYRLHSSLSYL